MSWHLNLSLGLRPTWLKKNYLQLINNCVWADCKADQDHQNRAVEGTKQQCRWQEKAPHSCSWGSGGLSFLLLLPISCFIHDFLDVQEFSHCKKKEPGSMWPLKYIVQSSAAINEQSNTLKTSSAEWMSCFVFPTTIFKFHKVNNKLYLFVVGKGARIFYNLYPGSNPDWYSDRSSGCQATH